MVYKMLADFVVLIHFLWIIFLFFGALWGVRKRVVKVIHLGGLLFAFILNISHWYCPLTYLEVYLRLKHNPDLTYAGSFIIHYVEKMIYVDLPTSFLLVATILLCLFNLWFYLRKCKLFPDQLRSTG